MVNEYKYLFNRIVTDISLVDQDRDSVFVKAALSSNEFLIFRLLQDDWVYFQKIVTVWISGPKLQEDKMKWTQNPIALLSK